MKPHDSTTDSVMTDTVGARESWPVSRRRLFVTLGWAAAGFAGEAVLTALIVLSEMPFQGLGFPGAAISVAVGFAVFAGVFLMAFRMTSGNRVSAQALLWLTALAYALLINLFASAMDFGDDQARHQLSLAVAGAVLFVGVGVLLVCAAAVGVGYQSDVRTVLRWLAVLALVAGPVALLQPDAWWVGLLAGLLLAWAVDLVVSEALQHPDVPAPALAACLVAAVSAVVLLVIYAIIRFVWRRFFGVAGAVLDQSSR